MLFPFVLGTFSRKRFVFMTVKFLAPDYSAPAASSSSASAISRKKRMRTSPPEFLQNLASCISGNSPIQLDSHPLITYFVFDSNSQFFFSFLLHLHTASDFYTSLSPRRPFLYPLTFLSSQLEHAHNPARQQRCETIQFTKRNIPPGLYFIVDSDNSHD